MTAVSVLIGIPKGKQLSIFNDDDEHIQEISGDDFLIINGVDLLKKKNSVFSRHKKYQFYTTTLHVVEAEETIRRLHATYGDNFVYIQIYQ